MCGLFFLDESSAGDSHEQAAASLCARWPEASLCENPAATKGIAAEVAARMRGQPSQPLSLLLRGTSFQTKVWQALLAVPEGRAGTYQGLARLAGIPGASRAVGTAMATNPIGYLIPCHRVVRASGAVGDYQWGSPRKHALLAAEGVRRMAACSEAVHLT